MTQPTLNQLFPAATQTATDLAIPKTDLVGLTGLADNNADQIMAGIVAAALAFYTPARREGDSAAVPPVVGNKDISVIAELGSRSLSTDFNTNIEYEEQIVTLKFYKVATGGGFIPNSY
ncbi:MAG: hypothetical protein ACEQSC_01685 [Candidatus Nanopelagicaceae bacterium]